MQNKKKTQWMWYGGAPLLILVGILASCQEDVTTPLEPAPPARPLTTCDDSAIRLLDRSGSIHGAIVTDTLHMGGAETPVTCVAPEDLALLARLSIPDDWTAQVQQSQQSQYYLIVIRSPDGNFLYVVSRRGDGTMCVVNTIDECVAQVIVLPEDFELERLPPDVPPLPPEGRPSPPPPGTPSLDPPPETGSAPAAAGNPQPRDGATGVAVETLLLVWTAADRAAGYDVYWGPQKSLAADADLGTPIETTFTATTIRRPALGTTYYWRVDAKNDYGTTKGSVWSFSTATPPPVVPPPPPEGGGYTPPVLPPVLPPPPPPNPLPNPPGGGGYTPPVIR